MKAKVGIIGPEDSLNLIIEIAKEYDDQLNTFPFVYRNVEETPDIIKNNKRLVDVWIFSGLTPYLLAKKSKSLEQPSLYLTLNGSSLVKTLLESGYIDRRKLNKLTIDMLNWKYIKETFSDLNLTYEEIKWYEIKDYIPINEIIRFHTNTYKNDPDFICYTCIRDVYNALKKKGIPVYRITPTRASIHSTIKLAIQHGRTLQFQQSQIAVIVVKVKHDDRLNDDKMISYEAHRINLKLQSPILSLTEEIFGSFIPLGMDTFIIYSTRGSLQNIEQQAATLLNKMRLITDSPANIGIGYGDTTFEAEENARLALIHAQDYDAFTAFLVDNIGTVTGPLQNRRKIEYGFRSDDKEIRELLKNSGLTITTFNKILSVQHDHGKGSVTARRIADWLKMSERNARRILNSLLKAGLAEIIGEESSGSRGRPRNIYRVGLPTSEQQFPGEES